MRRGGGKTQGLEDKDGSSSLWESQTQSPRVAGIDIYCNHIWIQRRKSETHKLQGSFIHHP